MQAIDNDRISVRFEHPLTWKYTRNALSDNMEIPYKYMKEFKDPNRQVCILEGKT